MCRVSKGKAVLDALRSAGVPKALREGVVQVLADAGFEMCVEARKTGLAPRNAFTSIDLLVPGLMERMSVEQSRPGACKRQAGYHYARLAMTQKENFRRLDV